MTEETKKPYRFARVSQAVLDWHLGKPMTLAYVLETAEDVGKLEHVRLFEEKPPVAWGAGVYEISDDGSLKLIAQRFDTSD